jgi:hypothetical protein
MNPMAAGKTADKASEAPAPAAMTGVKPGRVGRQATPGSQTGRRASGPAPPGSALAVTLPHPRGADQ